MLRDLLAYSFGAAGLFHFFFYFRQVPIYYIQLLQPLFSCPTEDG